MSALLTSLRTSASRVSIITIPRVVPVPSSSRSSAFHSSSIRSTLKESDKNRDDAADVYERAKEDNLRNVKAGKGKWQQELASNSEAAVKADRGEIEEATTEEHVEELQKESIIREEHVEKQSVKKKSK